VLLSALSIEKSGEAPLRILPPEKSIVDRVHDCRIRSWSDVDYGEVAGWTSQNGRSGKRDEAKKETEEIIEEEPVGEVEEEDSEFNELSDAELQAILDAADEEEEEVIDTPPNRLRKRAGAEFVEIPSSSSTTSPTLESCISLVSDLLGSSAWTQKIGKEVGISGPQGVRIGIELAKDVGKERWEKARRIERCYRK